MDRYDRQTRYQPFGPKGQKKLRQSTVLLCGCGALGSTLANLIVRAGVGRLRIVDRDRVDLTNLHRQILFDEDDAAADRPKAVAARDRLRRINSEVEVEALVTDLRAENFDELARGADLILDGTDNFPTRLLINDWAVKHRVPWIFGGCAGTGGQTMTILPGETPCLRCLIPQPPLPGSTPTVRSHGILGPIVGVIASMQALEALKILGGHRDAVCRTMNVFDLWDSTIRQVRLDRLHDSVDCPCCQQGRYVWLETPAACRPATLPGETAVGWKLPGFERIEPAALARHLDGLNQPIEATDERLRMTIDRFTITLGADATVRVDGTADPAEARSLVAQWLGF